MSIGHRTIILALYLATVFVYIYSSLGYNGVINNDITIWISQIIQDAQYAPLKRIVWLLPVLIFVWRQTDKLVGDKFYMVSYLILSHQFLALTSVPLNFVIDEQLPQHSAEAEISQILVIFKGYWQPKFLLCYLKVLTHLRMNMVLIPRQSLLFKSYSYLNSPKF